MNPNTKRTTLPLVLIGAAFLLACSQAASDEQVASTGSPLEVSAMFSLAKTQVELPPADKEWEGSQVQLLAADAYYNCTNVEEYSVNGSPGSVMTRRRFSTASDQYLFAIFSQMTLAEAAWSKDTATARTDLARDWYATRAWMAGVSFDVKTVLNPDAPTVPGMKFAGISATSFEEGLDTDLRTAGFNLCMAQQLRKHGPGAAANSGLFLSEAEQRELLEVVRERSQVAMLQFALFASVLAKPTVAPQNSSSEQARLGHISSWLHNLPVSVRTRMGNDFATAVQLNVIAVDEVTELFGRSRSKRDPFGRLPAGRGDTGWGDLSWFQREMAAYFGGDPLALDATVDGGAPWKGMLATPGAGTTGDSWPTENKLRFFRTETTTAQVQELMRIARQNDVLALKLLQPNALGNCAQVDVQASADAIYHDAEAKLRDAACPVQGSNQCMPSSLADDDYWLVQKFRITREHAKTLVRWLAEAVTYVPCPTDPTTDYEGALAIDSDLPLNTNSPQPTVVWSSTSITFKSHASLKARPLQAVGPLYSRMAPLYLADVRDVSSNVYDVGLLGFNGQQGVGWRSGTADEAKRILGALGAHAAVARIMIGATSVAAPTETYFNNAQQIISLSRGAAGGQALSLRAQNVDVGGTGPYEATGRYRPTILVDSKTNDIVCDNVTERCVLYALYDQPTGADLSAFPNTVLDRNGVIRTLPNITNGAFYGYGSSIWGGKAVEFDPIMHQYSASGIFSYVLLRTRGSNLQTFYKWDFIAGHVKVRPGSATSIYDGQELAFEGDLGVRAAHASQPLVKNPVEHAFDGFGFETHWVPPLTAGFLGGAADQSSVEPMLKMAEDSADEAEKAIQTAVEGLLERQRDDAGVIAVAQAKSALTVKQERDGLCGPSVTDLQCESAMQSTAVKPSLQNWYAIQSPGFAGCVASNPTIGDQIDCAVGKLFFAVESTELRLANPVLAKLYAFAPPAFHEYEGGSLQSAFIEQWRAVRSLGAKLQAIYDRAAAAKAAASLAADQLKFADLDQKNACGVRIAIGVISGISTGFPSGVSCNLGPALTAINECLLLKEKMTVERASAVSAELEAYSSLTSSMVDMTDMMAAMQQSSAKIASLGAQAQMAQARAALDIQLAKSSTVTSFPLYRNFRDSDVWRAKAVVESARRYALAARRSMEARYVVDLTDLDKNETFVGAPSVWADDIYGYDLSLPKAVGLTIPTNDQKDPNAIYKSVIKDYVANLRGFINGYAASRPSAIAQEDIDVINIAGLAPFGNAIEAPGAWQLLCGTTWVPLEIYKAAQGGWNCGSTTGGAKATRARVGFNLDPWGRLNGAIATEPYTKRYNTRWGKVALNVVGTGVKDCSLAVDPLACYANGTIRYNLTHVTPTWTTDYDGIWRQQDVPLGQIEGGKGLAVELFLNPLKDGWNTQFISAVARTEYVFRPVGGAYNLEFEVTPEVILQRIERMQLLVGTSAWVKQK